MARSCPQQFLASVFLEAQQLLQTSTPPYPAAPPATAPNNPPTKQPDMAPPVILPVNPT